MNKNMNNTTTSNTITIPVEAFEHMFVIMGALSQMHLRLINLYEIESDLKKRHKAYLHIREQAEEICKEDRKTVFAMIESLNPKNFLKVESSMSAVSQPKNAFESESCVGCDPVDACAAHDDKQDAGRTDNAAVLMSPALPLFCNFPRKSQNLVVIFTEKMDNRIKLSKGEIICVI